MGDNFDHQDMEEHVDVTISGGGPTGLFTAVLLQQLGISVQVIDGKPGPLEFGRADALNARTQQYLEVTQMLDDLLAQGIKCNTSSIFADGIFKSRQNQWWTSLEYCQHRNFLMIGQPDIEKLLVNRLNNNIVHYSEKVVDLYEYEDGVTIITDTGRKVHSRYLIGADGARSTVRTTLGIPFTGTKPEMVSAVLDTFLDTDFPTCPEIITFQLNGRSKVSWIPRERGMARFYVLLDGDITQKRAEDSIREHLSPYRVEFIKTEWFSKFEVKERIASSFISKEGLGRIILAGDAAHVHPINGGQGLNTGMADAFSLAWRLSLAIHGSGLESDELVRLIKSYDIERRAIAQSVIDVATTLVRDTKGNAEKYLATIAKNGGFITGMGVSYEGIKSDLIMESQHGIWISGQRCPDITLTRLGQSKEEDRLYSFLSGSYGSFLILELGDLKAYFQDQVKHIKLLSSQPYDSINNVTTSSHISVFVSDVILPDDKFFVVVRPDMYIGFVGEDEGCRAYMSLFGYK